MPQESDIKKVEIHSESDIVNVRKSARDTATEMGFGVTDVTRIVTAASELARNIYRYAESGDLILHKMNSEGKAGLELIFQDKGPGIHNIDQAMLEGYTTGGGLGLGLPGTKRLMDEMEIESQAGKGTRVTIRKWKRL